MWKVACMGLSSGTQGSLHSLPAPQSRQSSSLKSQMGRCFPRGLVAFEQNHTGGMHMPRDIPDAHMRAHASLGADDQMPLEQD